MAAHPEDDGAFARECEMKALRRLAKLTESENERVALRASEVLLRYVAQQRRDEPLPAKVDPKPPVPKVKVPAALLHPPKPRPAFRAVPLDKLDAVAHLFGEPSVPPVLSNT